MPKCCICGKEVDPKNTKGIYGIYGRRYYCKDEFCQERFIEDAYDPPTELYETPQNNTKK